MKVRDDGDRMDERELWISFPVSEAEVRQLQAVCAGITPREACIAISNGYQFEDVLHAVNAGALNREQIVETIRRTNRTESS